jgi:hypothetical protein
MNLFEYLFYRVYHFYKDKNDSTPIFMGCLVLSLICCLTILSFIMLVSCFGNKWAIDGGVLKSIMLLLAVPLPFLWMIRYKNSELQLKIECQYQNESQNDKYRRGWFLSIYIIILLLIPISIGYMRHNLGMNI